MELLFSFICLLLILIFTVREICISFVEKAASKPNKSLRLHKRRHGHRCYIEGLSRAEHQIVELLANALDHNKYFIFNNLYLPSATIGTTQVDHVVVSQYGIFVIESKEYSGWIYANPNRKYWTQTTRTGGKFQFYNPLFQNFAHISAIKHQLGFLGNRIESVVVFSGTCEFKTPKPKNVFYEHELVEYIQSKQEVKLKEVELLVVIGKLSMLCQVTDVTTEEHIENIKNAINQKSLVLS